MDLPRNDLLAHADRTLKQMPGAKVYFKFTCSHCGERVTFDEANRLFEVGTCCNCGKDTVVTQGGYVLDIFGNLKE